MYDIQTFYNEMETSFDEETKKIIKRFIDRMNDNDDNLKGLKKDEIKLLLYNSREKIQTTNKIDIEL
jgi:nucleosome binding factor SPN SPT16 subunit